MRECWAKDHDLRKEKWHFLQIEDRYCNFDPGGHSIVKNTGCWLHSLGSGIDLDNS